VRTLPGSASDYRQSLFRFARELKAMSHLADADSRALRPLVQRWHDKAGPRIGRRPCEETLIDFLRAWPKVEYAAGTGPLVDLLEKARHAPAETADGYEQPALRLLVSLARQLHRTAGGGPWYLSCRTAARLLGVTHDTAARWLFLLTQDGVLKLVSRGTQATRKASEYRYTAN